jgi:hypothetical protein
LGAETIYLKGEGQMKRKFIGLNVILLAVLLILPLQVHADGAKATIEGQIDKMLVKMKEPAFKELSRDAKLAEIRKIINTRSRLEKIQTGTANGIYRSFQ